MSEKPNNTNSSGRSGGKSQLHGVHHQAGSGHGNIGNSSRGRGGYNNCNASNTKGTRKPNKAPATNSTTIIITPSKNHNANTPNGQSKRNNNSNNNNGNRIMKEQSRQKLKEREAEAEAKELAKMTNRLNSEVIRRKDGNFEKIIKVSAQVALYEYDCSIESWKKCNTSGSLFLYKRNVEPRMGLFILNRNSLENFALMVTPDIEIQVEKPNILMKTDDAIRCFWFYNEDDCMEVAKQINKRTHNGSSQGQAAAAKPEQQDNNSSTAKSMSMSLNDLMKTGSGNGGGGGGGSNEGNQLLKMLCDSSDNRKDPFSIFQNDKEKENTDRKKVDTVAEKLMDLKVNDANDKVAQKVPKDRNILKAIWPDQSSLFKINLDLPSLFSNFSETNKDEIQITTSTQVQESTNAFGTTKTEVGTTTLTKSSSVNDSINTVEEKDAANGSKRRATTQKGTQKKDLDSLGAELRATLGITNSLFNPVFPEEENETPTMTNYDDDDSNGSQRTSPPMMTNSAGGLFSNKSNNMTANFDGFNMDSWQNQVREIMEKGNRDNCRQNIKSNNMGAGGGDVGIEEKPSRPEGENTVASQLIRQQQQQNQYFAKPQGDTLESSFIPIDPTNATTTASSSLSSSYDLQQQGKSFLNDQQMLQAAMYLLKTEKGFASKLESAYIRSLSDT